MLNICDECHLFTELHREGVCAICYHGDNIGCAADNCKICNPNLLNEFIAEEATSNFKSESK